MSTEQSTPVAVAVVRRGDEVLIGPRPEGGPLSGYWEFPGGKVRPREDAQEAARRECLEETGLKVRIEGSLAVVEHEYAHGRLRLHFVSAVALDPEQEPAAPFRWVALGELGAYRFPAANGAVLEMLGAEGGD